MSAIEIIDRFIIRIKGEKAEYIRNGIDWATESETSDAERVLLEEVRAAVLNDDSTPEYLYFEGSAAITTCTALIEDAEVALSLCLPDSPSARIAGECLELARLIAAGCTHQEEYRSLLNNLIQTLIGEHRGVPRLND